MLGRGGHFPNMGSYPLPRGYETDVRSTGWFGLAADVGTHAALTIHQSGQNNDIAA